MTDIKIDKKIDKFDEKSKMEIDAIIWNNWGVVEVLSAQRQVYKEAIIEKIFLGAIDHTDSEEAAAENSVFAEVRKLVAGRGVEAKFFVKTAKHDGYIDAVAADNVSLGAITVDFPEGYDGTIHVRISASLPQKAIFSRSLEQSKLLIEKMVKASLVADATEANSQGIVNESDLKNASGRNDIAKRIVTANKVTSEQEFLEHVGGLVEKVLDIFEIYMAIPNWLSQSDEQ